MKLQGHWFGTCVDLVYVGMKSVRCSTRLIALYSPIRVHNEPRPKDYMQCAILGKLIEQQENLEINLGNYNSSEDPVVSVEGPM